MRATGLANVVYIDSVETFTSSGTIDAGTSLAVITVGAGATIVLPAIADYLKIAGQAGPAGQTLSRPLWLRRTDSVAGATVTIDGSGAELIDGATSFTMAAPSGVCLVCDGSQWRTVAVVTGVASFTNLNIPDGGTLTYGTGGTDVVHTADGTDEVVTGTGDVVFGNDFALAWGQAKAWSTTYVSASDQLQLAGLNRTNVASASLRVQTGTALSSGSSVASGSAQIQTGAVTASGTNGGASGAWACGSGASTVTTAHTGGASGPVTLRSGSTDSTNAGGTGGASGAVTVRSGDATSTLGVSGSTGAATFGSGDSVDGNSGNVSILTGTAGGTRGSISLADAGGSYRMIDQVQSVIVTIPGGNGPGNVGDLNTTPVTAVAAPGAGYYLEFVSAHEFLDFATTPYDVAATLQLRYTNGSGAALLATAVPNASLIGAAADAHVNQMASVANIVPVENAPIVVHTSADPFGAAGDSPVKIQVFYRVRTYAI